MTLQLVTSSRVEREKREVTIDSVNECAILGAALVDPVVRRHVVRRLAPDLFLSPANNAVALALKACEDRALEPTPQALAAHGRSEDWGGDDYVRVLVSAAAPRQNLRRHVENLEWDAARFRVLRGSHASLTDALCDSKASPEKVQSAARAVLSGLQGWAGRRYMREPKSLAKAYKAELAVRRTGSGFVPTGYDAIDSHLTEGFAPRLMTLVVGLSGIGKSTFGINLALRQAIAGRRVLIAAWEVGSISALDVAVACKAGLSLWKLKRADLLTQDELEIAVKTAEWITSHVRFMDNPFFAKREPGSRERPSNERNFDLLEGYLAEAGCDVVVLDLFDRMLAERDPERDVAPALYRMHSLLEEYGCHGVLLAQLRLKDVEKRVDRRPTREGIKGTSAYVDVPDLIFGVHHPVPQQGWIEVPCLKQRNGPEAWAVRCDYAPERCLVDGGFEVEYDPSESGAGALPATVFVEPGSGGPRRRRKRDAD